MDNNIMFKLTYGLFIVTAKESNKSNGCIINTVMQQTAAPNRISITINKQNFTKEMISKTHAFNVSIIDETAEFSIFKHFGFQSGKDVDKFAEWTDYGTANNQIPYITKGCCGFLSAKVITQTDLGSHMLFLADVTDGQMLSKHTPMTYSYYHSNVKPKPQTQKIESKGEIWICKVCGYIYDEEKEGTAFKDLPDDWVCPLCKHGKEDFEKTFIS